MVIEENPFDHVLYEFLMYVSTMFLDTTDQMRINLQVDSHLVHLRNLAYFFNKKKDCDIHASEYIVHPDKCCIETKKLSSIFYITNCAACHMSNERLKADFKAKTRDVEKKAFRLLLPLIIHYIELLDTDIKTEYKAFWANENIQEYKQKILRKIAQIIGFDARTVDTVTTE